MKWARFTVVAGTASSHKSAAAVSGVATALALSPWAQAALPFAFGFLGAVVVHAWTEPKTVSKAAGSAVVSVALGGVGGPAAMDVGAHYFNIPDSLWVLLLTSFVLAATWPLFAPVVWDRLQRLLKRK